MQIRTFNPIAGIQSAQGLDVSNFQGQFDWSAAKREVSDLQFGIYRLTQGLGKPNQVSPDPDASWNHKQIRDQGLHPGAYHFLDPLEDGTAQAQYYVSMFGQLGIIDSDMLWLDNETGGSSAAQVSACANAFMDELHKLRPNNPMGVYTYIDFATSGNCAGLGKWPLWLAFPNSSAPVPPPPWSKWTFWQWGNRGAGGQNVDADAFNGTSGTLTSWIEGFKPGINPVAGLEVTRRGFTNVDLAWKAPAGATSYTVKAIHHGTVVRSETTIVPSIRMHQLQPLHTYEFTVRAHPGQSLGADATITATTH